MYEKEVKRILGEKYEQILRAARDYKIPKDEMDAVSAELGSAVRGNHMRRVESGAKCDDHEMKRILSDFYNEGGCNLGKKEFCTKIEDSFLSAGVRTLTPGVPNPMICHVNKKSDNQEDPKMSLQTDIVGKSVFASGNRFFEAQVS